MITEPPTICVEYLGSNINSIRITINYARSEVAYRFDFRSDKVDFMYFKWPGAVKDTKLDLHDFQEGIRAQYVKTFNLGIVLPLVEVNRDYEFGKTTARIILDNLDPTDAMCILDNILKLDSTPEGEKINYQPNQKGE